MPETLIICTDVILELHFVLKKGTPDLEPFPTVLDYMGPLLALE